MGKGQKETGWAGPNRRSGGGIFSILGVVIGTAGAWAWLSFAAAGRVVTGFGALAGATASVALIVRLISTDPLALVFLGLLVLIAIFGRPVLLRHVKTESRPS